MAIDDWTPVSSELAPSVSDADLPPRRGQLAPPADERVRSTPSGAPNPQELDGPDDLVLDETALTRAALPPVAWPASDADAPDYAHLIPAGREPAVGDREFEMGADELELLIKANAFEPEGWDDRIVVALRGARLAERDQAEGVDRIKLEDARPNHRDFNCTIGYYSRRTRKLSAFKASTVPNVKFMTNYYQWKNGKGGNSSIGANMLPTGCYVFRVGSHGGGRIYPALRLTDPDRLTEDGTVVVLRTHNDLTFRADDLWDRCTPYDHVHCAYDYDSFSSAGCLTICGPDGAGPWGRFQSVLKTMRANTRLDLVLLTGREASIAAYLHQTGRAGDAELVARLLGRLRNGSSGDVVRRLQQRLGNDPTGYFGGSTKKLLTEHQRSNALRSDGIYSAQLDVQLGWDVMVPAVAPSPLAVAAAQPAPSPQPASAPQPVAAHQPDPVPQPDPTPQQFAGLEPDPMAEPQSLNVRSVQPGQAPAASMLAAAAASAAAAAAKAAPVLRSVAPVRFPPKPAAPQTAAESVVPVEPVPAESEPRFALTADTLKRFAPRALPQYRDALLAGNGVLALYGINETPERFCHFLGQIGNECGRLTILEENMNYTSAARIKAVWPTRFPTLSSAEPYVSNPQRLAERAYGDRFDNRPGDGRRYRGRGFVQITGRSSYREMGTKLGIALEDDPDLACHPDHALTIACETWMAKQLPGERDMNRLADLNKLEALTYRINGGYTNLDDRRDAFHEAWKIWGEGDLPDRIREPNVLDRGDRAGRVDELNARMKSLGLFSGITREPPQHVFTLSTYKALRRFQESQGLALSGVAGADTWTALDQAIDRGMGRPNARGSSRAQSRVDQGADPGRELTARRLAELGGWAIALAFFALAFVALYIFVLMAPDRLGFGAHWIPLLFAFVVFVGGLAMWLAARLPSAAVDRAGASSARSRSASPFGSGSFVRGEEEPVRQGLNLEAGGA